MCGPDRIAPAGPADHRCRAWGGAAAAPDPFIAQLHGEFAQLRAGYAAAVTATVCQVLGREPRTMERFLAEALSALAVAA